jgi:sulfur-oxidizing protein SoxZ
MAARIQVPAEVRRGEIVEIRLLVQHPMETGYRSDETGKRIARNTIRTLTCRYDGVEVFRADLSPGIAANPYLQFTTVAEASGMLEFEWVDDAGVSESARQPIQVSG